MRYIEDYSVGERFDLGTHRFTEEDIVRFAQRFDPQPFHVDAEAGKRSHFGALCASGWHTASIWMRLFTGYVKAQDEAARARGEPVAELGPSPGMRDIKWFRPVYVGDTLTYFAEVAEARRIASRPGWGVLTTRNGAHDQEGREVLAFTSTVLVAARPS